MKRSDNGYATERDVAILAERVDRLGIRMERLFEQMRGDMTLFVNSIRESTGNSIQILQKDVDDLFVDAAVAQNWQEAHDRRVHAHLPSRRIADSVLDGVSRTDRRTILRNMRESFSEDELESLAFDLGVKYGNLPGRIHFRKCEELLAYMERHGRIGELVNLCREKRPLLPWPMLVDMLDEGDEYD